MAEGGSALFTPDCPDACPTEVEIPDEVRQFMDIEARTERIIYTNTGISGSKCEGVRTGIAYDGDNSQCGGSSSRQPSVSAPPTDGSGSTSGGRSGGGSDAPSTVSGWLERLREAARRREINPDLTRSVLRSGASIVQVWKAMVENGIDEEVALTQIRRASSGRDLPGLEELREAAQSGSGRGSTSSTSSAQVKRAAGGGLLIALAFLGALLVQGDEGG